MSSKPEELNKGHPLGRPLGQIPQDERAAIIRQRFVDKQMSLADALRWCSLANVALPDEVGDAVTTALDAYEMGFTKDLAQDFGIAAPLSQRKASIRTRLKPAAVRGLVDAYHAEDGLPMSHPAVADSGTAFHAAAEELELAPGTVHRLYYSK